MPVQRRFESTLRVAVVALALPVIGTACASAGARGSEDPDAASAREAEVADLRRDNAALRNRVHDLEEQVRLLERADEWGEEAWSAPVAIGESEGATWEAVEAIDDGDGPRELPVVKLTPKGRSVGSRPVDDSPPPEQARRSNGSIALAPVPHSGVPGYGDDYDDVDYVDATDYADAEPSGEPASYRLVGSKLVEATKAKPVHRGPRDKGGKVVRDYEKAMAVYRDGKYADAEEAFAAIVAAHPNHDYADNALYWQGEAAYDQAHYADALAAFTSVVERYGGGNKAPDALLKIGLCYGRLGDADNARDVLTQLIAAYPRAQASKIAKRKLADLD